MRRKVAAAVLTAALVGVVGAEGIIKVRQAALPEGSVTVEEMDSATTEASHLSNAFEQLPALASATTYRQGI